MILHARGPAGLVTLLDQAREKIQALDRELPILAAKPLAEQTAAGLGFLQTTARTLLIFGGVAIALAAMGLYGLVSYTVKQSTHEIGIRIALGAQRSAMVRLFLNRGLRLGLVGAALGLVASLAATRYLKALLYDVSATDLLSFTTASAVVLASALVATFIPARRAARTNPITALRQQ